MALLAFEGFDGLVPGESPPGWSGVGDIGAFGRNSTTGMRMSVWGDIDWHMTSAQSVLYMGVAAAPGNGDVGLVAFTGPTGTQQIGVYYKTATSNYQVACGASVLGTSASVVTNRVWAYLEFMVILGPAGVGRVIAKQNGTTFVDYTGDTRASGTDTTIGRVRWLQQPPDNSKCMYLDDIYLLNDTGTPNTFFGDCKVVTLLPNGNGNSSQGTGSDGNSTDNYLLLDDSTPSTADYVDISVGEKDTYAYANHGLSNGTVQGVQVRSYVSKSDAGAVNMRNVARLSTTEVYGASFAPASGSYAITQTMMTTRPTGGAWTLADVDAAEFGVEGLA